MKRKWDLPVRYAAMTILSIIIIAVVWYIRELFKPLVVAGFVAYLLSPVVAFLNRTIRLSRKVSANLVYFISLAVLVAVPAILMPVLFDELQTLVTDLNKILTDAQVFLAQPLVFGNMRLHLELLIPALKDSLSGVLAPLPEDAWRLLETTSKNAAWFLIIVVCTYYFMTDFDSLREWLIRLAPDSYRNDMRRLYLEIRKVWIAYLRGQITLMIIVGIIFVIIWSAIGLPGALVLGILAGLFSLVPEIGPFAATILAFIVALLEGSNWLPVSNVWFALIVIGFYAVLINFKNIWLRPRILGRSVRMHEGLVFVAIIAAVVFSGILGALVVVPVLASAGVIFRYIRRQILGLPPFPPAKLIVADSRPDLMPVDETLKPKTTRIKKE